MKELDHTVKNIEKTVMEPLRQLYTLFVNFRTLLKLPENLCLKRLPLLPFLEHEGLHVPVLSSATHTLRLSSHLSFVVSCVRMLRRFALAGGLSAGTHRHWFSRDGGNRYMR